MIPAYARVFLMTDVQWDYSEVYKKLMRAEQILGAVAGDYPELEFRASRRFKYRPAWTIYYEQNCDAGECRLDLVAKSAEQNRDETHVDAFEGSERPCRANMKLERNRWALQLLHEVGHALAGHRSYVVDVERVRMEREAWEKARELCAKYGVDYEEDFVEEKLDTYRDWLDRRSRCKKCGLTRYQDQYGAYHCPGCELFGRGVHATSALE